MPGADIAHAACDHDGLVIASQLLAIRAGNLRLKGTKVACQIGAAKFIIERGGTNWPLQHNIECRGHPLRFAKILLPRLHRLRDTQVGDGEPHQPGLGFGASAGCTLIANLATGTGCCTWLGRDGCRVVVSLHLHQDMNILILITVDPFSGVNQKTLPTAALNHGCIVFVGGQNPVG